MNRIPGSQSFKSRTGPVWAGPVKSNAGPVGLAQSNPVRAPYGLAQANPVHVPCETPRAQVDMVQVSPYMPIQIPVQAHTSHN